MADSRVVIDTKLDNRGIIKGVRDAARKIQVLADEYKKTSGAVKEQEAIVAKLKRQYDEAAAAAKEVIFEVDPKQLEVMKKASDEAMKSFLEQSGKLTELRQESATAENEAKAALNESLSVRREYNEAIKEQSKAESEYNKTAKETAAAVKEQAKAVKEQIKAGSEYNKAVKAKARAQAEQSKAEAEHNKAISDRAKAIGEQAEALRHQGKAESGQQDDARNRVKAAREAATAAIETVKITGRQVDATREAAKASEENVKIFERQAELARKSAEAAGQKVKDLEQHSEAMKATAAAAGESAKALELQAEAAQEAARAAEEGASAAERQSAEAIYEQAEYVARLEYEWSNATKAYLQYRDSAKEGNKEAADEAERLSGELEAAGEVLSELNGKAGNLADAMERVRAGATFGFTNQAKQAQEDIAAFEESLQRLNNQLAEEQDPATIIALRYEIQATEEAFDKFMGSISQPVADIMQIREVEARLESARNKVAGLQAQFDQAKADGDPLGLARMAIALNNAKNEAGMLEAELRKLQDADLGVSQEGAERARTSLESIGKAAQSTAKRSVAALRRIGSGVAVIAAGAAGAARGLARMSRNLLGVGRSSRRASNGLERMWRRMRNIALTALVFGVMRRALNGLVRDLGRVLMANEQFARSWNEIRVNMLTAFAPLWEVIQPAIISFMQLLAKFTAVLAQFMATLFGRTIQQARASAKALNEQAKGLDKVGGAASKAQKQLAPFDELNILNDLDTGGSSGADALDFDFEPPDISWMDEFVDKLRDFFKDTDFEYWFDLGALAATKFAEALRKIPWNSIRTGARNAGINLAGFIGGMLSNVDAIEMAGYTIAQSLNTALEFLYGFGSRFPWADVGYAIGRGINKFFKTFDWGLAAKTFNVWARGILDLLIKSITTVDWPYIGWQIADFLNGIDWFGIFTRAGSFVGEIVNAIARVIGNFAKTFDWRDLGFSVAAGIMSFFGTIDWAGSGSAISGMALDLLHAIGTAIRETDWAQIGLALREFLTNINWHEVIMSVAGLAADAIAALFELLSAALGETFAFLEPLGELIGGVIVGAINILVEVVSFLIENFEFLLFVLLPLTAAFVTFKATLAIQALIKGIALALQTFSLKAALAAAKTWLLNTALLANPIGLVVAAIAGIVTALVLLVKNFDKVKEGAKKAWEGIKAIWDKVLDFFRGIVNGIKRIFGIRSPSTVMANMGISIGDGLINGIRGKIGAITGVIDTVLSGITSVLSGGISKVREIGGNIAGAIGAGMSNAKDAVVNTAKSVGNSIVNGVKSVLKISSPSKVFTNIGKNLTNSLALGINSSARSAQDAISDTIAEADVGNLEQHGRELGASLLTGLRSAYNPIMDFFKTLMANIQSIVSSALPVISPSVANIKIPELSRGAIVDSVTINFIIEKGRTSGVAAESNDTFAGLQRLQEEQEITNSLLREMIEALRAGMRVSLDGRVIATAVNAVNISSTRRGERGLSNA